MLNTDQAPAKSSVSAVSPTSTADDRQNIQSVPDTRQGLRSHYFLGQHPAFGVILIIVGGLLFGVMAINLQTQGSLIQFDLQISNSIHTFALQSSPFIRDVMISGYYAGEHLIIAIGLILLVYFLFKRFWAKAGMVLIAWLGEGSIWVIATGYFHRARPVFAVPVWHQLTSYSFPSGHSLSAVMCYGLLAYLLLPRVSSGVWKIIIVVSAGVIIIYIGFSRIFVGDHYPTDVLAGYGLGIAWSAFVYTTVEIVAIRVKNRRQVHRVVSVQP